MQSTYSYSYDDASWGDLLTTVGDDDVAYDEIGNPLYIGSTSDGEIFESAYELIWEGRQLVTHRYREYYYEDDIEYFDEVTYTYNADGIRTSKTVEGIKHEYILNGSQIIAETWTESGVEYVLFYFYDETGAPLGIRYRTSNYAANDYDYFYFEKNLQGDIVAVYNESGTQIGLYYYDAWGNFTTYSFGSTGLERYIVEDYNPFRYRGYYYDIETGYYYLQSRYYNPVWGRFLNADGYVATGQGLLGNNMYVYCNNNPANMNDLGGNWPRWITATVAVLSTVVAVAALATGNVAVASVAAKVAVGATAILGMQSAHYDARAEMNEGVPPTYDEAMKVEGADNSISAACHQFTAGEEPSVKVCFPDGREGIYNSSGEIVTDSRDMGTYNSFVPNDFASSVGHAVFDVLPWIVFGNSDSDPGPIINYPIMWVSEVFG